MKRIAELDSLRGLAAIAIVLYHAIPWRFPFGWVSVDMFFVLSGYLITGIILENAGRDDFLKVFYARRSLRIWPLYYATLLFLLVLNSFMSSPHPILGLPYYLTFTQNVPRYWGSETPPFLEYFSHTWTLAIEEQFYLIWPALILLAGSKRVVPLAFVFMVIPVTARALGFHESLLLSRCDGFALGGLLAAIVSGVTRGDAPPLWLRPALVLTGVVSITYLGIVQAYGHLTQGIDFTLPSVTLFVINLFFFSIVGLVLLAAGHPVLACLRMRWLCYIGTISYGLYVYHFFFCRIFLWLNDTWLGRPWWVPLAILGLGIVTAALSWEFFERPILSFKSQFEYGQESRSERKLVEPVILSGSKIAP